MYFEFHLVHGNNINGARTVATIVPRNTRLLTEIGIFSRFRF